MSNTKILNFDKADASTSKKYVIAHPNLFLMH